MRYLLLCDECGEKTPIDVSQAGRRIACRCGQMLGVPSLRGIRELETLDDLDTTVPRPKWTVTRRVVFAIGLLVCVIGLAVFGLAVFNWTQIEIPDPPVFDAQRSNADIDAKTPAQAWDEWMHLRAEGLGHYRPPAHVVAQGIVKVVWTVMAVAAGVAIAGLVMAVGVCFVPNPKRNR